MNVVFDVGNVLVRWSPVEIMRCALTESDDAQVWAKRFFGHPLWRDLNRGLFSEREAQGHYVRELSMDPDLVESVFHHVKATQELVAGTTALLPRLQAAGYPMYALTDNVHEIVAHLRNRYDFWQYFRGVVVSAEVGLLKPEPAIFRHLLETHALRSRKAPSSSTTCLPTSLGRASRGCMRFNSRTPIRSHATWRRWVCDSSRSRQHVP